jgi:alpha-tubulin suppressor-like RCC1 family protein
VGSTGSMCMLMPGGSMQCVGGNFYGNLGDGTTTDRDSFVSVNGAPAFAKIAVGSTQSCGITSGGDLYCWGNAPPGGAGLPLNTKAPRKVIGLPAVAQVAPGHESTCALATDGVVWCWGAGTHGQLGDGLLQDRATPQPIAGGRTYVEVAGGISTTCALTAAGEAYCWGENFDNQRGDEAYAGGEPPSYQPIPYRAAPSHTFTHLTLGYRTVCGIRAVGPAICWGHADEGKLGTGAGLGPQAPAPVAVPETIVSLATPTETGCAASVSRQLYCWGFNYEGDSWGMLNIPSPFSSMFVKRQFFPVRSLVGISAVEVTGMHFSTCVRDLQGSLYCFGPQVPAP